MPSLPPMIPSQPRTERFFGSWRALYRNQRQGGQGSSLIAKQRAKTRAFTQPTCAAKFLHQPAHPAASRVGVPENAVFHGHAVGLGIVLA